jgi:aminoglycoside phosphotransferase (APT) family kinase protein
MSEELREIARAFAVGGTVVDAHLHASGLIHETFVSTVRRPDGRTVRYLHQRMNRRVFRSPEQVMENIARVTEHLRRRIAEEGGDPERGTLTIVPTGNGAPLHTTESGEPWRTFVFIEGAQSYRVTRDRGHAHEAAAAFGRYVRQLDDLPAPPLHETIAGFGDPSRRHTALLRAIDADVAGRVRLVGPELRFVERHAELVREMRELFAPGALPERVVHHDTKVDNVLIDDGTGKAVAVVDLDTTMPGRVLYDFGDLVRLGAARAAEDERDPARVVVDRELHAALRAGYLEATRGFLSRDELETLDRGGRIVALTLGMRFLTDFLEGDLYFKTSREGQNLDRCRVQFALVSQL